MKIKDNIADEFSEFSKNYTHDMIGCVPHYLKLMSCFTETLPKVFNPENILDLGCGNGNVTSKLLQIFPDANYTLLDASQEMLNLCQQQFKDYKIEYVTSYFQDHDFKTAGYDLIVAGFSLHHCDSEEKKVLFKEINRSLKKGGIFSCTDLMISKDSPKHSKLLEDWKVFVDSNFPDGKKWDWLMEHYNEFDKPDDFKDQIVWLQDAGFRNIEITTKEDYWMHLQAVKD
ncbi:MAG: class I SAM-dependent methyltransferase [Flavobacteriaceae bacterium]|nr:class I SAM-dependent methyltransferase [Flavobacteriaceae bacterium]